MNATPIAPVFPAALRHATDEAVVALLATHASAAVGELYRRFAPRLRASLIPRTGAADAADIVQTVFLVVLTEARFHPAPSRVYPWLAGIAKRLATQRGAQLMDEKLVPADVMVADPWIEEIDGPRPREDAKPKGRRGRRG